MVEEADRKLQAPGWAAGVGRVGCLTEVKVILGLEDSCKVGHECG